MTENTEKEILKRRHDKKSRVNTDKHLNEATKRRKKFKQERALYFDIIESKSFEEDFCSEDIDCVIKRMDRISEYKYFCEFELTSQAGHMDFLLSSLERDYKRYFELKCSNLEDVPDRLKVDSLTSNNDPAEVILDSSSTNCNDNNDGHHRIEQLQNEHSSAIEIGTIMNEYNTSRTDETNNIINFDHNGIFLDEIGFLNYGRQELNEMAKDNHWFEVNDVMVAFNLIGQQKHNVHCHNDVIIFDKSDDEKGEGLNLQNVEKNILQRVSVRKSIKEENVPGKILKIYFILCTLFSTEKQIR